MMHILLWLGALLLALGYGVCRIWRILPLQIWWRVAVVALWLLPLPLLALQFMASGLPLWFSGFAYTLGTAGIIIMFYTVMLFLLLDVGSLFSVWIWACLRNSLYGTLGVILILTSAFVYGNTKYHDKVRIALDLNTSKSMKRPLRIVALSDLHLGHTIGRKELARWVDMINAEQPDLILIAGDLVDGDIRPLMADKHYEELNRLNARLGVFACLGNHEYIGGEATQRTFLSKTNITLLRDSALLVGDEVYIVGRDDYTNRQRQPTEKLLGGIDKSRPIILLDHQPHNLNESARAGIDLHLSGHTHGGQIFPINLIVNQLYERAHGYERRGQTHYYISSGLGIWGGKFRIGTQSEYAIITLGGKP